MTLDPGRLRAFLEVARAGGYPQAARRLHVTPSALSHALRRLQADLGRQLFDWRGRRFTLTAAGERLFQICQAGFDRLDEAEGLRAALGATPPLRVTLGSTIEFGVTVLVQKLRPLLDAHPGLHVDFHLTNDLAGPLLRDEVDLAVDCHDHVHPRVHRTALFREKYVVVAAPALLERQPVRGTRDLARVPLLSLDAEGRWWTTLLGELPAARRPRLGRVVAIDHVRGMIQATLAGYGVGLLPKYAVLPELQRGALVTLFPRLRLHEDTFCVYQKLARLDRPGNRLLTAFLGSMDVREFGDAIGAARARAASGRAGGPP